MLLEAGQAVPGDRIKEILIKVVMRQKRQSRPAGDMTLSHKLNLKLMHCVTGPCRCCEQVKLSARLCARSTLKARKAFQQGQF